MKALLFLLTRLFPAVRFYCFRQRLRPVARLCFFLEAPVAGAVRALRAAALCLRRLRSAALLFFAPRSRKEVFQPHLPVRLPCYDLAPVTCLTLGRSLRSRASGTPGSHGLTGGVYKARERIHRAMADARLLANPASRSRVADSDPN